MSPLPQHQTILSVYFGYHDSNVCFAGDGQIKLHLEAERVLRRKHARVQTRSEMDELIKAGLQYLGWQIEEVDVVLLGRWNNLYTPDASGKTVVVGRHFNPVLTSHHMNHVGTVLTGQFDESIVICADGGSEDGVSAVYHQKGFRVSKLEDLSATAATGRFYGTLTQLVVNPKCSAAHNHDAGKTMGLAAFGAVDDEMSALVKRHADRLNDLYFDGCDALRHDFGISDDFTAVWKDTRRTTLARCGQEYWIASFVRALERYSETGLPVCVVGGCALNVALNERLRSLPWVPDVFVPPVPNDSGQSIGAVLTYAPGTICDYPFLGRHFGVVEELPGELVSDLLSHRIVAWYEGRAESGPRALGHRSFLALPDSLAMRRRLSQQVKRREPYRPVAPVVTARAARRWFPAAARSPFMSFAAPSSPDSSRWLPAVVSVDGTSRLQVADPSALPVLAAALAELERQSRPGVLMNTSFNVAGQPIVDTPDDAYSTFLRSGADVMYVNGERVDR